MALGYRFQRSFARFVSIVKSPDMVAFGLTRLARALLSPDARSSRQRDLNDALMSVVQYVWKSHRSLTLTPSETGDSFRSVLAYPHGPIDSRSNRSSGKNCSRLNEPEVARGQSDNRVAGSLRSKPKTPHAHLQRVRSRDGPNLPAEVGGSEQIEPTDQSENRAIRYPIPGRVSDGLGRTI